ncbi:hypothetical protein LOY54_10245 [Pseudomonas sp. B21-032]|uniref:hypothetical protein n=1 Tax=Pseudomonas sp. B21-032 TaxID=2895483 RepID=UPI00215E4478|nr:hypothetical protein [Pseudomonas sp. B21-032]UVL63614.1 hypothetical protein LOY54_10245 [Pseudomonas sp. B21-032]
MNTYISGLRALSLGALLMGAGLASEQVLAADCRINLSESQMDFGQVIPPSSNVALNTGNLHDLGNRSISLNASCPQPSKLLLVLRGEQLGADFKFARQGRTRVVLSNALLDGRSVDLAQVKSPGVAPGAYSSAINVVPGDMIIPVSGGLPTTGSALSLQVDIQPVVPVAELRTREAKTLEANLSFQIRTY